MDGIDIVENFRENFYSLVSQIPVGKVTTYGDLAKALGDKRAARAVGRMLNQNPRPVEVPCHRVVTYDGKLGGYGKGSKKKKELLESEGIKIKDEDILNFEDILFTDFQSNSTLVELREIQNELRNKVDLKSENEEYEYIAGVDVSYSESKTYSALSIWKDEEEIEVFTAVRETKFPYIPTYLAFREIPPLLEVVDKCDIEPDVILVDGNGVLHPRKLGLATHLGLEIDIPTIGVAKSKLCGKTSKKVTPDNPVSPVIIEDETRGFAAITGKRATNPIYISPGHDVSLKDSLRVVRKHCEYKIPDPIRRAHIKANKRRKKDV